MITIEAAVVLLILLFILAMVLSFVGGSQKLKKVARIAASAIGGSLALLIVGLIVMVMTFSREPPTISQLQKQFPKQKQDLEMLVLMSNEDARFSRIAPNFIDDNGAPDNPEGGRFMKDDPRVALSRARWDQYRRIYKRLGIKLGVQRNSNGDEFIMADSVGLLDSGHATGYVFCSGDAPSQNRLLPPCMSNKDFEAGGQYAGGDSYVFRKLDAHWYAFDDNSTESLH